MKTRPVAPFALVLGVLTFSSVLMAQDAQRRQNDPSRSIPASRYAVLSKDIGPGGPAPKRDISGVWAGPLEAEKGEVPAMTPLGQKLFSVNKTERKDGWAHANDPWKTCDPFGVPRSAVNEIRGIAFAPLPNKIVVLHQYNRVWREVWMDGRALPKNVGMKGGPDPTWYGYSVGRWDGDNTLVIDTTGSDDSEWLDPRGYPHSLQGVFEERYTRVDHNHLEMTVTVDDPKIYTKPFVLGTSKFVWVPSQESEEQICVPSQAISYVNIISIPVAGDKEQK
jgi:hypothetical protein